MSLKRVKQKGFLHIGLDEAGRGCLAGPVTAGAVILKDGIATPNDLTDSKKLTEKRRDQLRLWIEENALAWGVAFCSPEEIDKENILQASMTAMHRALDIVYKKLTVLKCDAKYQEQLAQDALLLVDGHYFRPYQDLLYSCEKKGDAKYQQIAAASVLAKTHRDEYMYALIADYPKYGWKTNKGYPTKAHRQAIEKYGPTKHHRKTFKW